MALYRIMCSNRSRNHIHVDHSSNETATRKPPDTGSCVRGFSFSAVSAASLNGSDPEQRSNDAGSFVVTKAPAYRHALLGFS